jgi:hypothetical protein
MKRGPPAPEMGAAEEGMFSRRNELAPQWTNSIEHNVKGGKVCARFKPCSCGARHEEARITPHRDIDDATKEVLARVKPL